MKRRHSGNRGPSPLPLHSLCVAIALASAGLSLQVPLALADALPQGGQVVGGQASITRNGPNMEVNTASARTAIDWQRFNVGPDNSITFRQPDGRSVTLNRVIGSDPSKIYGAVTSNGQLILVNPNGIWLGPNSRISASALVASAGFLTDEQAKEFARSGKLDLQLKGLVSNHGRITVHDNGMVALLGAQVENHGVIQARKGSVQLATGPRATLDFHGDGLMNIAVQGTPGDKDSVNADVTGGVHNSGEIDVGNGVVAMSAERAAKHLDSVINLGGKVAADSVSEQGGSIVLGNAAQTNVSGQLSAKGSSGGSVKVLGDAVNLAGSARIDASGSQGAGGKVLVGGSYQGQGPEPAAKSTSVAKGAQLKADGKTDGGQVVVWSDGTTHFAGNASARGGERGGVVETSGRQLTVAPEAQVDAGGGQASGKWLLDPDTVNIEANGGDVSSGTVAASAIVNGLKTNDVDISASGRINVNSAIIAQNVGSNANGYYALRLFSTGNVGAVSEYKDSGDPFADAKRNDSGSVYINAPILLKNGHLVIVATGDVLLRDNAGNMSGDDAYLNRAILDVGKGTIWIKTANTASVIQDANTALIADKLAVQGASVLLDSPLNSAGTLAGKASNGVFHYNQTSADGKVATGKVASPYSVSGGMPESMDGVSAQTIRKIGEQLVISNASSGERQATLGYDDQPFDYLVFDAIQYVDANGKPVNVSANDSSDYLVRQMKFTDAAGSVWILSADASKATKVKVLKDGVETDELPPGLSFDAYPGQVVAYRNAQGVDQGWGVRQFDDAPGASITDEIQHNRNTGASEQMVVDLGGKTKAVDTTFSWLFNENGAHEAARVQFMNTTDNSANGVQLQAQKAQVQGKVNDASREYGEANPTFSSSSLGLAADASDNSKNVKALDDFVDRQLGQDRFQPGTSYSTAATPQSNVGDYAIKGQVDPGEFVARRYETQLADGNLKVTPAELTVTANDKSKVYGDADPALDYGVSGAKLGQNGADLLQGNLGRAAGENVGQYAIQQGNLGLNSGLGGNYTLKFVDGKLQITPATLTVTAQDKSKVYGDADPGLSYSVSGLKNGDSAAGVLNGGSLQRQQGENVRPQGYAIGQGDLGLASANYTLVFKDGTLRITPAQLVVTADDKSKVQGSADPRLTHSVNGLKNGDPATIAQGSLRRAPGEEPGSYAIGQDQAFSAGSNYSVVFRDGALTITGPLEPVTPPPAPGREAVAVPLTAQAPGNTRCTALESPSAVSANYSVSPAVIRTYAVQLICKPRAYGGKTSTTPDIRDVLTYANSLIRDGQFIAPDWNRSVIPHDLKADQKGGK
ncbi:MBG domain-containing protein [Pseudomonas sp. A6]|uniref:MBG domain-containing protein n=1 Tax=Pseudomonas sp. A6 TaxID=410021 RepID=UPI0040277207